MIKDSLESGIERAYLNIIKIIYEKPTANIILKGEKLKALILWPSAFFMVQLSHPYMTTGKTIALTRWTFVGKVMSLLFGVRSRAEQGRHTGVGGRGTRLRQRGGSLPRECRQETTLSWR